MKLNRALALASSFMELEPVRLRVIARALADRQAARPAMERPPEAVQCAGPTVAPQVGGLDASLAAMQSSHRRLTRAIDLLK